MSKISECWIVYETNGSVVDVTDTESRATELGSQFRGRRVVHVLPQSEPVWPENVAT